MPIPLFAAGRRCVPAQAVYPGADCAGVAGRRAAAPGRGSTESAAARAESAVAGRKDFRSVRAVANFPPPSEISGDFSSHLY